MLTLLIIWKFQMLTVLTVAAYVIYNVNFLKVHVTIRTLGGLRNTQMEVYTDLQLRSRGRSA